MHELLQEQGCRGVTAVSKGVEEIKSYLADRQDELQVIEAVHAALTNFHSSAALVESGCSAVWSVAFNHDGTKIVSGSGDQTIKVWDAGTLARPIPRLTQS